MKEILKMEQRLHKGRKSRFLKTHRVANFEIGVEGGNNSFRLLQGTPIEKYM